MSEMSLGINKYAYKGNSCLNVEYSRQTIFNSEVLKFPLNSYLQPLNGRAPG